MSLLLKVSARLVRYSNNATRPAKATSIWNNTLSKTSSIASLYRSKQPSLRQIHTSSITLTSNIPTKTNQPINYPHQPPAQEVPTEPTHPSQPTLESTHQHQATKEDMKSPASAEGVFTLGNVTEQDPHSRMLTLVFTCNVCNTRAARQFSHHSYTKGIVIIQCPGCEKYHLIADHLGWFKQGKDIEEFMSRKGESVQKITDANEVTPDLQEMVDEAARVREESYRKRQAYRSNREIERAELEAERKKSSPL